MSYRAVTAAIVLVFALGLPPLASAQAFGIGPRMSFVKGEAQLDTPATRLFGGTIRLRTSKHVSLEGSMDYHTELSTDGLSRLKERPIQGSLLLFPFRGTFAPYLLAGYGIYQSTIDSLDAVTGLPLGSTSERKTGAHLGFGAEVLVSRHTSVFIDYRYRFVQFGAAAADSQPVNIPGSSFVPGLDKVQLSHQGSMITSGLAFYF